MMIFFVDGVVVAVPWLDSDYFDSSLPLEQQRIRILDAYRRLSAIFLPVEQFTR